MEKEINIVAPEGYEIDEEKSTFEKIVFKKKEDVLPMSWKELKKVEGYYISFNCDIRAYINVLVDNGKNTWPSKEEAEAALALSQLLQLRNAWRRDWEPNWMDSNTPKYCIVVNDAIIKVERFQILHFPLAFQTMEMAHRFRDTFFELIKTAAPLL